MENTWEKMQELVRHMSTESRGTHTPGEPTATPENTGLPKTAPEGSGGPSDPTGTRDFASPMSWTRLTQLNAETPRAWKDTTPEKLPQGTPPVFRLPSVTLSPTRRKTTSPTSRQFTGERIRTSGSFRDLLSTTLADDAAVPTVEPQAKETPTPATGRKDKEPALMPDRPDKGKALVDESPRRRSTRKAGVLKIP